MAIPDRSADADVIVAGAGPAGAAAAMALARAGRRVVLCDRSGFPRDKACGDGLIADSIAALERLGIAQAVSDAAYRTTGLVTISPGGTHVRFQSTFWVVPRRVLDDLIVRSALEAGARFEQIIVESPIIEHQRVVGVAGRKPGSDARVALRAPLTMLATGGAAGVLRRFDPDARADASGVAIRTYTRPEAPVSDLLISLERDLLPGYAWAFPAPGGLVNLGVGALRGRRLGAEDRNLRQRLDRLVAGRGRLGELLGPQHPVTPYQGAPLRTGLRGAGFGRPGLVIIGEAVGTTYSLTGEGIGKAMESGLLAADLALDAGGQAADIAPRYGEQMRSRYGARFKTYDAAQRWVSFPFMSDYVAGRANRSAWVHERLTRVITEQGLPSHVFSARTLWRLATRR